MRLIDADAFVVDVDKIPEGGYLSPHDLISIINARPTIEKRKNGKWIRGDAEKLTGSQRCSICHKACYKGNDYFNYCPNCGADMRKPMTIPEEIINSVLGYDD